MVTKVKDTSYNITLTEDEVYTLQTLLGFVAGDSECNSIQTKLDDAVGEEVDAEDYDRVTFLLLSNITGELLDTLATDDEASVVIRIN